MACLSFEIAIWLSTLPTIATVPTVKLWFVAQWPYTLTKSDKICQSIQILLASPLLGDIYMSLHEVLNMMKKVQHSLSWATNCTVFVFGEKISIQKWHRSYKSYPVSVSDLSRCLSETYIKDSSFVQTKFKMRKEDSLIWCWRNGRPMTTFDCYILFCLTDTFFQA